MPLPKPPGFIPQRQLKIDRRRILLAALLFAIAAAVLLLLLRHAATAPGQTLKPVRQEFQLLVILGAAFCGGWNEWMRQIALTRRGEPGGPLGPGERGPEAREPGARGAGGLGPEERGPGAEGPEARGPEARDPWPKS